MSTTQNPRGNRRTRTDGAAGVLLAYALMLAAALPFAASIGARTTEPPALDSPTITALRRSAQKDARAAEAQFWTTVQRVGTPLVEPIPDDTANVLFTFLWHGDSATK